MLGLDIEEHFYFYSSLHSIYESLSLDIYYKFKSKQFNYVLVLLCAVEYKGIRRSLESDKLISKWVLNGPVPARK